VTAVFADPPNSDVKNGEAEATAAGADDAGNALKLALLRGDVAELLNKDGKGEKPTPVVELAEMPTNGEANEDASVAFPAARDDANEPILSLRENADGKVGNKDAAVVTADPPEPPNNDVLNAEAELTPANGLIPLSLRANAAELPKKEGNREAPVSKMKLPNEGAATKEATLPFPEVENAAAASTPASIRAKGEEGPGNKNEGDAPLKIPAPPPNTADDDAAADGLPGKQ